ncbi:saccharopine dehydrogenase NADP-binding domain-containing protein [bacterium]|nr:saccharopine dehydrogenase NADP-binding domain-containing protein [bacterium]
MKKILVLGAGQSSPALIRYLLEKSSANNWKVTVADLNKELAERSINNHPNGVARSVNVNDFDTLHGLIKEHDIVANLLSPTFQDSIVEACLTYSTPMVSASYESLTTKRLNDTAKKKGVLILNEMGLDPGLDHMSAIKIIRNIRDKGGIIRSFCSYGSGVPAPDSVNNPLKYAITWNPRNVVMSGQKGAQYYENGEIKIVPPHRVFERTWRRNVEGVGMLEAYPNRDSLVYLEHFDLNYAHTMIRGTLRYPGFSETWLQVVRLGLPNETMTIPELYDKSWRELTEMFLPSTGQPNKIRNRVARHLGISPTGEIMDRLEWLGLFSDEKIGVEVQTAADAMIHLLNSKLALKEGGRDMVILLHEFIAEYPDSGLAPEQITSTFVHYGDPGGETAMSKTVGLPAAIAMKKILNGELTVTGCQIPTIPEIYEPILSELESEFNIQFEERHQEIESFES